MAEMRGASDEAFSLWWEAQLARISGAPLDRGAGLDILKRVGDEVRKGDPLFRIYSAGSAHFDLAAAAAEEDNGFAVGSHPFEQKAHTAP